MLEKQTVIDQLEIRLDGTVFVRFMKQIVEDGRVLWREPHRTAIQPGTSVSEQMAQVNGDLTRRGYAIVDDYSMISAHVAIAHTAEAVAAFKAAQGEPV